jgi:large subunit ribosomal protein L29
MAIGTKDLRSTELDNFEEGRLTDELKKAKEELFNLRFQIATGTLESHGRVRAVKRDIARIYTVLRERELGIRATPAPVEVPAEAPKKRTRKAAAPTETTEAAPAAEAAVVEDAPVTAAPTEAVTPEEAPAAAAEAPKTPRKRAPKKEGE